MQLIPAQDMPLGPRMKKRPKVHAPAGTMVVNANPSVEEAAKPDVVRNASDAPDMPTLEAPPPPAEEPPAEEQKVAEQPAEAEQPPAEAEEPPAEEEAAEEEAVEPPPPDEPVKRPAEEVNGKT